MILSDLPQIRTLSPGEKLGLVDEIWRSFSAEFDGMECPESHRRELDARWADYLADPAAAMTVEAFKKSFQARRG